MIRLHQDDVASWQNLGPQESRQVTPVRPSPTPLTPREVLAQPGQQTEQRSAVLLTARQVASEAQLQHMPVAFAVAVRTLSPDLTISNPNATFPYGSAASASLAESDAPQAISIVGDSQEESEAIREMRCKVAASPEDFPKALASPEDLTGLYRGHSKADQCAPNPKSLTPAVLRSPYHTITAPHQYTPALSFLGSRAPLSIYKGRS